MNFVKNMPVQCLPLEELKWGRLTECRIMQFTGSMSLPGMPKIKKFTKSYFELDECRRGYQSNVTHGCCKLIAILKDLLSMKSRAPLYFLLFCKHSCEFRKVKSSLCQLNLIFTCASWFHFSSMIKQQNQS